MVSDIQVRIDNRLKELAKKACASIGCSGADPDMCQNHPQDCKIVREIMGYRPDEQREGE